MGQGVRALLPIFLLAVVAMLGTSDCGGSSKGTGTATPQVAIAITQPAPATMAANASITVTATVSNDSSNAGVIWEADCPYSANGSKLCGTITYQNATAGGLEGTTNITAPSGAAVTYTSPAYYEGGTVTLQARAVANKAVAATTSVTLPSNVTISFTTLPPATMTALTTASIGATIPGIQYNDNITYTATCKSSSSAYNDCGSFNYSDVESGYTVVYTAPSVAPTDGIVTITAKGDTYPVQATTTITIVSLPTAPVSFGDSCCAPPLGGSDTQTPVSELPVGGSVLITANVMNDLANTGVDWSLSCGSSAAGACGTLSAAHTPSDTATNDGHFATYPANAGVIYTAPATVPASQQVTLTAASTTSPSVTASTTFTIQAANANGVMDAINGQFAFYVSGRDQDYNTITGAVGGAYTFAGSFVGNGQGLIYGYEVDMMDFDLGINTFNPGSGEASYTMAANGRGRITFNDKSANTTSGWTRTFSVAFIDNAHALLSEDDSFGSGAGMLYRQNLTDITAATNTAVSLNGSYTVALNGAKRDTPTQRLFVAGDLTATADSSGKITETSFVGDASGIAGTKASAKATTQPVLGSTYDAFGRSVWGTVDLAVPVFNYGSASTQSLVAYMIDKNHYLVMQNKDKEYILGGTVVAQPSTPAISGSYVFTESGMTASGTNLAAGGVFSCGGSGTMDTTSLGGTPTSKESIKATCTAPSNGRGVVSLSGSASGIGAFAAYPTVDGNLQLVEIDAGGPSGSGTALPQQSSAIAASTFSGYYATSMTTTGSTSFEGLTGHVVADGLSSFSGTVDATPFSDASNVATPANDLALTGSDTADASGRFTASLNLASTTAQQFGGNLYFADAGHALLLVSDASQPGTGVFTQPQLPLLLLGTTANIGQVGVAYNSGALLETSGGVMPFTYALTSGTLPAGLTLGSATGAITGTPASGGVFTITVKLTDATGATVSGIVTFYIEDAGGVSVSFTPAPPSAMGLNFPIGITASLSGDHTGLGIDW
jgi:hypothetical protein